MLSVICTAILILVKHALIAKLAQQQLVVCCSEQLQRRLSSGSTLICHKVAATQHGQPLLTVLLLLSAGNALNMRRCG
jgi:hypothetical protein